MRTDRSQRMDRRGFAILLATMATAGCQTFPTGADYHPDVPKPVQLVTLAQTRLVSDPDREGEFKNLIVVQTFLLDKYMQTIDARGTFNFYVYLDGENTDRGVEPDHQWMFTAEETARWRSQQEMGTGYTFELPVSADKDVASRVTVVATYTNPNGNRLMSKNDLANVPTVSKVKQEIRQAVVSKQSTVDGANSPLPTRDSKPIPVQDSALSAN